MTTTLDVKLVPMTEKDLELVMAWRSHPEIFSFFKLQQKPLEWIEHHNFWISRVNREDYIICYQQNKQWRKVGNLNISLLHTSCPEIGIVVGEVSLHGKGVGSKAVELGLKRLLKLGHTKAKVSIHQDNAASNKLFKNFGFVKDSNNNSSPWLDYKLEDILI